MMIYRQNHAARGTQRRYIAPVEHEDEAAQEVAPRPRGRHRLYPPVRRVKAWDYTAPVLLEVERWLKRNDFSASRFGKMAIGDPNLVTDLRSGRDPSSKVVARIRAYMAKGATDGE